LPTTYEDLQHFLFLAPAATMRMESKPLEELLFNRDEYANMVWAQERTIRDAMGTPCNGYDMHLELNDSFPTEFNRNTEIQNYRLASAVPTNWIPYLPLHKKGSNKKLELHQAKIIRNEQDGKAVDILPLTFLASQDLIRIQEAAIPQAGLRVQITKQRVRWTDGQTYVWQGRKVIAGNGEGNSGLRFDYLD